MFLLEQYKRKVKDIPHVHTIGFVEAKSRIIQNYCFDTSNFSFIFSGSGYVMEDQKKHELNAPFVIFERNHLPQYYGPNGHWNEVFFTYKWDWTVLSQRWGLPVNGLYFWKMNGYDRIQEYVNEIKGLIHSEYIGNVIDKLDRLVELMILESLFGDEQAKENQMINKAFEIEKYIRLHYKEALSVQWLAAQCGVSIATFRRMWNKAFTISPYKLIISLRMQDAYTLLLTSDEPIQAIAYEVGFIDPLYFTKIFSSYYNISPSNLRKKKM